MQNFEFHNPLKRSDRNVQQALYLVHENTKSGGKSDKAIIWSIFEM